MAPVKTETPSSTYADLFLADQKKVTATVEILAGLSPEQYTEIFIDVALKFAEGYSYLHADPTGLFNSMVSAKPEPGQLQNQFWAWFKVKYTIDDGEFLLLSETPYPPNYLQHKAYLIGDEILEKELADYMGHPYHLDIKSFEI